MRCRYFKSAAPWVPSFLACCLFIWVQIVRAEPCPQSEPKSEEAVPSSGATLKTAKTMYIEPMPFDLHVYIITELNKCDGPYRVAIERSSADLWMKGTAEQEKKTAGTKVMEILTKRETPDVLTASVRIVARGGEEVLWTGVASDASPSSKGRLGGVAKALMAQLRDAVWQRPATSPYAAPAEETGEPIPASGATLQTAQTMFIEPMPYNLHVEIIAEFYKQKGPYRVSLSKREADLRMKGTAEVGEGGSGGVISASVFITARGGQEILWAGDASDSSKDRLRKVANALVAKFRDAVWQPPAPAPYGAPAEETGEPIPASGATLRTAQTIYVEPLPYNLHTYLVAEFNKQKGPYRVSLSKREADLWMRGTAEVHAQDPGPGLSGLARERGQEAGPIRVLSISVFITPRGSQEALWSETSSGYEGNISGVAGGLVKKLRKFLKQD